MTSILRLFVAVSVITLVLLSAAAQAFKVSDYAPAGGKLHFHWTDQNGNQIDGAWDINNPTPIDVWFTFNTADFPKFNNASDWYQKITYADGSSSVYSGNVKKGSPWELHPLYELDGIPYRIPDLAPSSGGDTSITIYTAVNLDLYFSSNPNGLLGGSWSVGQTLGDLGYSIVDGMGSDGVEGIYWATAPIFFDPDSTGPGFATSSGLLGPGNPDMLNTATYPVDLEIIAIHTDEAGDCVIWYPPGEYTLTGDPCDQIPTLSEWAMIIFAVVILALMTYVVVRRRRSLRPTTA